MLKITLILGGLALLVVLVGVGCQATRAGYKSAPYKVVRQAGKFEVRDYPALILVETPMAASGGDGSFSRLFNFITGRNASRQKIAMTTPVFMAGAATNTTMAFVLPATMAAGEVPRPTDPAVTVREMEPGRFAVFRFTGGRNPENEAAAVARLQAWMAAEQLPARPGTVFGYFDPPWTPAFLRRNEVMIRTGT
ncbi:MAG: heme-binding protein [Verrucomicrobiota bacterium]